MRISNIELIQASMETIGALFCLLTMFYMSVNKLTEKIKLLLVMYGVCAALFFLDAGAYIFRGNTDSFSFYMTGFCNNGVFLLNVILAIVFMQYLKNILKSSGIPIPHLLFRVALSVYLAAGGCVVVNYLNNWMFGFDTGNYYHRNMGWYVYTLLFAIGMVLFICILISVRSQLNHKQLFALFIYLLAPLIATVLQVFLYGLSITNLGVATALTLLLLFYLKQQEEEKKKQKINSSKEHNMISTMLMFTLMVLCMGSSIITCVVYIQKMLHENTVKDRLNIAQLVRNDIDNTFSSYLTSSKMIASDYRLTALLEASTQETAEEDELYIKNYLSNIKDTFGYQMAFVASEYSNAYYTYEGISKYLDVENNAHDIWYKTIKDSGSPYQLNVDTDEVNNHNLTVFINHAIYDASGTFIGVGGVGIGMNTLQEMLAEYERDHQINIYLVKPDRFIQISTNNTDIEQTYMDQTDIQKPDSGTFLYQEQTDLCRMICYLDELDWYLVIEDLQSDRFPILQIIFPSIGIYLIGMLVMGIVLSLITRREHEKTEMLIERTEISLTDELTGLHNRRAYAEFIAKLEEQPLDIRFVLIMMDVNGLKTINDSFGHDAGDAYLIGAAECIRTAFGPYGEVFRIGGDEFIALLHCSKEEAIAAVRQLDEITGNWSDKTINGISISKGAAFVCDHPDMTISMLEDLADRLMYDDKDAYYQRTGFERRRLT